jgi:hypothetical protein
MFRMSLLLVILLLATTCSKQVNAWLSQTRSPSASVYAQTSRSTQAGSLRLHKSRLFSTNPEDIDEATRVKLKEEIASPFRALRRFAYIAVGSSAGLGFVTTLPQLALSGDDQEKAITTYTNLAINLAGAVAAVFFWVKENESESAKIDRFADKEKVSLNKMSQEQVQSKEDFISKLPVRIQINEQDENATRIVSFGDLQQRGSQNVIIVAGGMGFVKDSVMSARLEGEELFNQKETLVVPVVLEGEQLEENAPKGFAAKEGLMEAPYIAKPEQVQTQAY